ncbi:MAG: tetratricopeptide repeat protein [Anaerolineales bacterium]|nr:tetratricopeptide repeat protein [Anaerolineales bacterium]
MCVKPNTPAEADTLEQIRAISQSMAQGALGADLFFARGRARKQVKHLEEAVHDLTHALESTPPLAEREQAIAYNLRGICYRRLERYPEAIADADQSLELRPEYSPFWADRGWAYVCAGQTERGIEDLNRALELHPYFLAFVYRGAAYFDLGNFTAALADYDRVIELYAENISYSPFLNRGILRLILGYTPTAAEADFDISVARLPDAVTPNPRPYAYRGLVRAMQGRYTEALADLQLAEKQGADPMIPLARSLVYARENNPPGVKAEMLALTQLAQSHQRPVGPLLHAAAHFFTNPVSILPGLTPLVA